MCHTPPLCGVSHIGEVSRSDGGVEKTRLCLFILPSSEKNELRSSGSYRAIRLVAPVAVGVCGTRSARTVLALFPPSPLRLHRPIKADRGLCICLYSNPLALRALPLYSLTETQGERDMHHSVLVIEGISPSPLPCPVALREVAQQYRGETEERQRRREGLKKKHIGFFCRTNPLARWALPLYRYAAQGERFESVTSNI